MFDASYNSNFSLAFIEKMLLEQTERMYNGETDFAELCQKLFGFYAVIQFDIAGTSWKRFAENLHDSLKDGYSESEDSGKKLIFDDKETVVERAKRSKKKSENGKSTFSLKSTLNKNWFQNMETMNGKTNEL